MRLSTVRLHQLLVVATILVPGVALVAFALANRAETLRDRTQAVVRTDLVMREHARKVFDTVELALDRADDYAYARSWRQIAQPQTSRFLASLKGPLEDARAVWIADAEGALRAGSQPFDAGRRIDQRDFFAIHAERAAGLYVSALYTGANAGAPSFAVSRRRSTPDGSFDGTVHASLDPGAFARFYAQAAAPMAHVAALVRADGAILVQEPPQDTLDARLPAQVLRAAARLPAGGVTWTEPGEPSRLIAFHRVGEYPLYVVFAVDRDVLLQPWYARLAAYGTAALVAALTLGLVAWLALQRARAEADALARLEAESAQRRDTEAALRQSQKMEAVGQLTGGLAHDFNNHLAVITGGLELVQRRLARGERDVGRFLDSAIEGAVRAAKLTHRLLVFSRRQAPEPASVDPNRLVSGLVDLLRRTLGERITVETRLAAAPPAMLIDENQLENAILNLAVNARDAMPDGGRLVIETRSDGRRLAGGPSVMLTVRDTGTGMPPEVVARALEPFFTTKAAGRGTGLGLAQVHGFVTQSGGEVEIESVPGAGTAIHLLLPAALAAFAPAAAAAEPGDAVRGRGETILVVEDDAGVRAASVEALSELGYRPLDADGAEGALALLEAHPDVALLLTDMVMPQADGASLAEAARARRPGLPVLFATGYGRDAEGSLAARMPDAQILRKPVRLAVLAQKVDALLRAREAAAA